MRCATIPYGIRGGEVTHISEIDVSHKGLKCGCICPDCGEPLVARMGCVNEWHFAHHTKSRCSGVGSIETSLHLKVKQIVSESRKILLPCVYYDDKVIRDTVIFPYKEVHEEVYLGNIVPDLSISDGVNTLYIEVVVSHDIDDEKLEKIREKGISVLKLDFSDYYDDDFDFSPRCIKRVLLEDSNRKEWVTNTHLSKAEKDYAENGYVVGLDDKVLIKKLRPFVEKYPDLVYTKEYKAEGFGRDWLDVNGGLRIRGSLFPDYLNYPIKGETIFGCDRWVWQTLLFSVFVIHNKRNDGGIWIKGVLRWLKRTREVAINWDMYNMYKLDDCVNELGLDRTVDLAGVLCSFFNNLCDEGFIFTTSWSGEDDYLREFRILDREKNKEVLEKLRGG